MSEDAIDLMLTVYYKIIPTVIFNHVVLQSLLSTAKPGDDVLGSVRLSIHLSIFLRSFG